MAQIATHHTRRARVLGVAGVAFAVAIALHGTDHMRQARGLEALAAEVLLTGIALAVAAYVTLALILSCHPRAASAAAAVGLITAAAVASSHLAPHWSAFSDPYWGLSLDAYSWLVMLAEVATALILGVVGASARHSRAAARAGSER